MIRIKHLIRALQPERADEIEQKLPKTIAETILNGAAIDSRQIISGALFVAIQGERTDGHHFVAGAFENKASAALIQFPNPDYPVLDLRAGVETTEMPDTLPCCILVDHTIEALQTIARYWRKELNLRVIGITGSVGKSTTKELVSNVLSQRYRTLKNRGNLNNEIGLPLTILDAGLGHERAVLEMGFYVPGEITFLCDIAKPQIG
ncbi:MAG: hypothetical protein JW750_07045, partial [Anaerolineaceae bacterium]|nr:hypothetical protein [Anaerolineaceae bacterium]